jgi:hypothetical protein
VGKAFMIGIILMPKLTSVAFEALGAMCSILRAVDGRTVPPCTTHFEYITMPTIESVTQRVRRRWPWLVAHLSRKQHTEEGKLDEAVGPTGPSKAPQRPLSTERAER